MKLKKPIAKLRPKERYLGLKAKPKKHAGKIKKRKAARQR